MNEVAEDRATVALIACRSYDRSELKTAIDSACRAAGFAVRRGMRLLLKPNLVSAGGGETHLGCSSPEFVAAAAEWCLDYGAEVRVGDSPAFGSAGMVMRACGITRELERLGVRRVNFTAGRPIVLPCGIRVPVAVEALECEALLNLPRVKTHSQLYVSLAVKNYFGVVVGWRKALHHAVSGDVANRFESLLVELPALFPGTFSLLEGVTAMHRGGPIRGEPFPLGLIGAAFDPFALDTSVMAVVGADPRRSQVWSEGARRGLPGTRLENVGFPLLRPEDLEVEGFDLPDRLKPVTFHPARMLVGACRRIAAGFSRD